METTDKKINNMADCNYIDCIYNGGGNCATPCHYAIPTSFQSEWYNHKGDKITSVYFRSQPGYYWEKIYINEKPPKRPRRITKEDYIFYYEAIQEEHMMKGGHIDE